MKTCLLTSLYPQKEKIGALLLIPSPTAQLVSVHYHCPEFAPRELIQPQSWLCHRSLLGEARPHAPMPFPEGWEEPETTGCTGVALVVVTVGEVGGTQRAPRLSEVHEAQRPEAECQLCECILHSPCLVHPFLISCVWDFPKLH